MIPHHKILLDTPNGAIMFIFCLVHFLKEKNPKALINQLY